MRISESKVAEAKARVKNTPDFLAKSRFIDQMATANIPAQYWFLKFSDFKGAPAIKTETITYVKNLRANFHSGAGICYAGNLGTGKTYAISSILKSALKNGYSGYYTTFSDLPTYLMNRAYTDEFYHLCTRSDFLAIDEVDARHISSSEEAIKLFATFFERLLRYRQQNALPMLMATNHAEIGQVFKGQHMKAIESLLSQNIKAVTALGKDFRKK